MLIRKEYNNGCLIVEIIKQYNEPSVGSELVGQIIGYINARRAVITSLYVNPIYRNNGYGMKLMKDFLTKGYGLGVIHIELDDCSDNYRKNHNIYIKCGFKYTSFDNLMYANTRASLIFTQLKDIN